jgi:hypothetical protein
MRRGWRGRVGLGKGPASGSGPRLVEAEQAGKDFVVGERPGAEVLAPSVPIEGGASGVSMLIVIISGSLKAAEQKE